MNKKVKLSMALAMVVTLYFFGVNVMYGAHGDHWAHNDHEEVPCDDDNDNEENENVTFSQINFSGITSTGAKITWDSNVLANSIVTYSTSLKEVRDRAGEAALTAEPQVKDEDFVKSHKVDLTGLEPSTTYYFRVASQDDELDQFRTSGIFSFTTSAEEPDHGDLKKGVVLSDIEWSNVTPTSARITWDSNKSASSIVNFDTTLATMRKLAGEKALNELDEGQVRKEDSVTDHKIVLRSLDPNTTYYIRVSSVDSDGDRYKTSQIFSFTTKSI